MNKDILSQNRNQSVDSSGVLRETALEYLREALIREEYEDCPELIGSAREYGAGSEEIREVLKEHVRGGGEDRLIRRF